MLVCSYQSQTHTSTIWCFEWTLIKLFKKKQTKKKRCCFTVKINRFSHWDDKLTRGDTDVKQARHFWEECVVPESAASSYQLKATVAGLHRQPDHRTEGLRVMMSLFCLGPQGSDLWANLGLSLQIPGLSLPGEQLMVQWDGATMQQESSQLTGPDIHLHDHTHQKERKK